LSAGPESKRQDKTKVLPERKRQARGEARIKSLLAAAETVFTKEGYNAATTNQIAAAADVSPATLYQFFLNKEDIANQLSLFYAEQLRQANAGVDFDSLSSLDTAAIIDAVIDPMLDFNKTHPAFLTLLIEAPLSNESKAAKHAIRAAFDVKFANLLQKKNANLSRAEAEWTAEVFMIIYKGFCAEISPATGDRKKALVNTLKKTLHQHLQDKIGR